MTQPPAPQVLDTTSQPPPPEQLAPGSDLDRLARRLGCPLPAIERARQRTPAVRAALGRLAADLCSEDCSLVVYGSLARAEWTPGSDVDWTLLVDGRASPTHLEVVRALSRRLDEGGYCRPGPSGVFGSITFSHDLYNRIGGQQDSNDNTTQRVLLLLESVAPAHPAARERTLRLLVERYLADDRGLLHSRRPRLVPRYLANDIVRYWRTMAVDFVDKQRGRGGAGWALRYAKLRLSRKLLFVSGMLACLGCELFIPPEVRAALSGPERSVAPLAQHLLSFLRRPPLEVVAHALLHTEVRPETAAQLLGAYDAFLAILEDDEQRKHLRQLPPDRLSDDPVFTQVSQLGRRFQEALAHMFFRDDPNLTRLMIDYGVF
ncbi:MAG: hypothetical protein RMK29_00225 [Myxococcales bacterium]|nr:DUF294 nucleotidyltransferase-like domain-containing protein [Myxococcota bacterium]MDW8280101.1 hypothetical protein [Myxococcales bacterium]